MTKGMRSTELWASVIATGVGAWLASTGADVAVIATVVGPMAIYTGGRSFVKGKNGG